MKRAVRIDKDGVKYSDINLSPTRYMDIGSRRIVYKTTGDYENDEIGMAQIKGFACSEEYEEEGFEMIDIEEVACRQEQEEIVAELQKIKGFPQKRSSYCFEISDPNALHKCT